MVYLMKLLGTFAMFSVMGICVGCGGGGNHPTAPVSGKVTAGDAAVTGGTITLVPVGDGKTAPGKPASGSIQSDGSFQLTTYQMNDGAVIGKHKVTFGPPLVEAKVGPDGHAAEVKGPYDGFASKVEEVEIKSGKNDLKIEIGK